MSRQMLASQMPAGQMPAGQVPARQREGGRQGRTGGRDEREGGRRREEGGPDGHRGPHHDHRPVQAPAAPQPQPQQWSQERPVPRSGHRCPRSGGGPAKAPPGSPVGHQQRHPDHSQVGQKPEAEPPVNPPPWATVWPSSTLWSSMLPLFSNSRASYPANPANIAGPAVPAGLGWPGLTGRQSWRWELCFHISIFHSLFRIRLL